MSTNPAHSPTARSKNPDPNLLPAIGLMLLVVITMPVLLAVVQLSKPTPLPSPIQAAAQHYGLDTETFASGRSTFATACVLCHGDSGQGVPSLGRPLVNSEFVQSSNDEQLASLITYGRLPNDPANASGVLMPARGANPAVTDEAIPSLIAFLRTMQREGEPFTDVSGWDVPLEERMAAAEAVKEAAAASGVDLSGPVYDLYVASCSACHGPRGEGMEGTGKPFIGSEFILSKTDKEMVTFIKTGRPIWDAENTTGIDMPPKGGNPALKDEEISELIIFIRSIAESDGG